jgi:two-component system, NarL family, nitrate/nitrite response regulator NarL
MEERLLKITSSKAESFPRVLVTDRDSMGSQLLADALGRNRYEASAVYSDDLLSGIRARKTHLVVIGADLHSTPDRGLELASAVHQANPEILIVILLDQIDREYVINAFRSGACGVFCRRQSLTEFLTCVEHVQRGGIWTGKTETGYLLEALRNIPCPSVSSFGSSALLTKRELQVVQCAAQGKTNKTIANELNLSEHTVKNYLFRSFEKLGVSSRVELLFYLTMKGHGFGQDADEGLAREQSLDAVGQVSEPNSELFSAGATQDTSAGDTCSDPLIKNGSPFRRRETLPPESA